MVRSIAGSASKTTLLAIKLHIVSTKAI